MESEADRWESEGDRLTSCNATIIVSHTPERAAAVAVAVISIDKQNEYTAMSRASCLSCDELRRELRSVPGAVYFFPFPPSFNKLFLVGMGHLSNVF
jgi:hypothetical protein